MPRNQGTETVASLSGLNGIRVIDLGIGYAGPTCGRILADMGAEVIKIESIRGSDIGSRRLVPAENELGEKYWEKSGYYIKRNINKFGLSLDLAKPEGRDILRKLVRISDVVIENFSPRVMEHFGLDYSALKEMKPNIIMISLSGYGHTGPFRDRVALGPSLEASTGMASLTGYVDGPPTLGGPVYIDALSGVTGAAAVLLALVYRQQTGRGQHIDLSERESAIPPLAGAIMDYTMNRSVQKRIGNGHPYMAPHGCYPCKGHQAWITIAVGSDDEWKRLCQAMDDPAWANNAKFSDSISRWQNRIELDELIGKWTMQLDRFDAMAMLQRAGIAAGVVVNGKDLLFDSSLRERGFFQVIDHPLVGKRPYPKQLPIKFSIFQEKTPRSAPLLCQDIDYVLGDLLGLSKNEIDQLEKNEVTGKLPTSLEQVKPRPWVNLDIMGKAGAAQHETDYLEQLSKYYQEHIGPKGAKNE